MLPTIVLGRKGKLVEFLDDVPACVDIDDEPGAVAEPSVLV
jgi:hypothetical protein